MVKAILMSYLSFSGLLWCRVDNLSSSTLWHLPFCRLALVITSTSAHEVTCSLLKQRCRCRLNPMTY